MEHVFMEKTACGNFRHRYFCIWRCQNWYEGAKDWGHTVERCLDGFDGLGALRFHGLLSFHLDFRLQKLVLALKTRFLYRDARFFLQNSGAMVFPR